MSYNSPFPGMDPYLESPTLWPDVHNSLMNTMREQLAPVLAPRYVAELETQIVIDRIDDDDDGPQVVLPDVAVTTAAARRRPAGSGLAEPAPMFGRLPLEVPTRLITLFIRARAEDRVVTVIEMLSPVNKRRGPGRQEYIEKRRAYLKSPVHLVEIDLLRAYPRMSYDTRLPATDYLLMVSRAGQRPDCELWPVSVRQPLPALPIPLLAPDPDAPLDLGLALRTAYTRARYDLRIDYSQPPTPPLRAQDVEWAAEQVSTRMEDA